MNPYDNNYNNAVSNSNPYNNTNMQNSGQNTQGQPNPYLSYKHFSEDSNYADPIPPKPPVEILTEDKEKKGISSLASSLVGGTPNINNQQNNYTNDNMNYNTQPQMYPNQQYNPYQQYPNNIYQNQQYNPYQQYPNNNMYPNNNQNNQN